MTDHTGPQLVTTCEWPDGTWCLLEDLGDFYFMSDDYIFTQKTDEALTRDEEVPMTEEEIINDQYAHHTIVVALKVCLRMMQYDMVSKDHHIERDIVQLISKINDKDERMTNEH